MELKPIKEKSNILYPTVKEAPKSNLMKKIFFATAITPLDLPVAVPCYVAITSNILPRICKIIREISIFITILSAILLFINKKKINNCVNDSKTIEKLNKHRKIKWWIFGIGITIIIITSIVLVHLGNYM